MPEKIVRIEKMCFGGAGLGRIEGKACFAHFTAPGEEARVRITRDKKSYLEAELVETLLPSDSRVEPRCPYFGSCGGCNWQHLSYPEQLRQKREILADTLCRIGKVTTAEVLPTLASEEQFGYRTRIQLKVASEIGTVRVGFYRGGTHEVIDLTCGCAIAHPALNAALSELRSLLPRLSEVRAIVQVDLSMGDDGSVIAVLHCRDGAAQGISRRLKAERAALASLAGVFLRPGGPAALRKVFGEERLGYRIPAGFLPGSGETILSFGKGGFSQVNRVQNLNLIQIVWEWGQFDGTERLLDLYCGNGNFSIPLAPFVREVVGVEGYLPSVEDARLNAGENGVGNASFIAEDAAKVLRRYLADGERFDTVVLDPPRSGALEIAKVAALGAEKILYVSCDPPTLARDLEKLKAHGYRTVRSLPVDMFPQTYHLESVTLLKKQESAQVR